VLVETLRDLPSQERSVLLLQAIGDFKYREIAEILQVPIGTVMSSPGAVPGCPRAACRLRTSLRASAPKGETHGLHRDPASLASTTTTRGTRGFSSRSRSTSAVRTVCRVVRPAEPAGALLAEKLRPDAGLCGQGPDWAGVKRPRAADTMAVDGRGRPVPPWCCWQSPAGLLWARQPAIWPNGPTLARTLTSRGIGPVRQPPDHDVETYRATASLPGPLPAAQGRRFSVRGTGIGKLNDHPAAYLSGEVNDTPVSIFVLPRDPLAGFAPPGEAGDVRAVGPGPTRWRESTATPSPPSVGPNRRPGAGRERLRHLPDHH
jgi:hypothetical protein